MRLGSPVVRGRVPWTVDMADLARDTGDDSRPSPRVMWPRADAVTSRERIIGAAMALVGDRRVSMVEIAAAAGVGRSTLYRHFPTRDALEHALGERAEEMAAP